MIYSTKFLSPTLTARFVKSPKNNQNLSLYLLLRRLSLTSCLKLPANVQTSHLRHACGHLLYGRQLFRACERYVNNTPHRVRYGACFMGPHLVGTELQQESVQFGQRRMMRAIPNTGFGHCNRTSDHCKGPPVTKHLCRDSGRLHAVCFSNSRPICPGPRSSRCTFSCYLNMHEFSIHHSPRSYWDCSPHCDTQ